MLMSMFTCMICTGSFFTTATYENFADFEIFHVTEEPIWILGVKYDPFQGINSFYVIRLALYRL